MFHAGGHKGVNTRGRSSGLGRHYPHFLSHVDWKAPLRCGILFCTFSCILFVIGVILTWLGVHDVFGESVPITGPILLAVGGLMLLLAFRQFYVAHVRKIAHNKALENKELGENTAAALAEHEDEQDFNGAETDLNKIKAGAEDPSGTGMDDSCEKPPLISGGNYDSQAIIASSGEPNNLGGYVWPPISLQHPYYSMAMMAYKDPSLIYRPQLYASSHTENYSVGTEVATGRVIYEGGDNSVTSAGGDPSSLLPLQQTDTAVLETTSTNLQQQTNSTSCLPQSSVAGSRQECSKIFPADYLTSHQRKRATQNNTSPGISSLPNPTAFMMLRTLELQETI